MVETGVPMREEFKVRVEQFCIENNITWCPTTVGCECSWVSGVSYSNISELHSVEKYIELLEGERKEYRHSKGFLWRLFN